MSKRCFCGAIALLCALTFTVHAQQATATPTPAASPSKPAAKSDPTGMGVFSKDRPKDAKTEITCKDETTFDNATGIATFVTNVFVKDPQFNLYCDKLTVYLDKARKGIEHAEAEGKVVIVQENKNDKGENVKSIGRSGKAVFVPASGEATLTDWPQLQQGVNNQVSVEQGTIMILNKAGRMKAIGPTRSVFTEAPSQ